MPGFRIRRLVPFIALALFTACSSATQGAAGSGGKITPPQQLRSPSPPDIREAVDIRYEVLIDAEGNPDLSSLKLTGKGSGSNRAAMEEWIRNSTFKPAMRDGHPVSAVFKGGIKSTIERRRM